jgi:hypothetical protein
MVLRLPSQGAYCWEVNVTAQIAGDAAVTNVTSGSTTTPTTITNWAAANSMTFSQPAVETYKVCFVKRAAQASAELTHDMCKTGKRECHSPGSPGCVSGGQWGVAKC